MHIYNRERDREGANEKERRERRERKDRRENGGKTKARKVRTIVKGGNESEKGRKKGKDKELN